MALGNSVSAAACVMIGLALIGNVLKGAKDLGGEAPRAAGEVAGTSTDARGAIRALPLPSPVALEAAGGGVAAGASVDDSLPTGSIEPGSALHRPNPAAYGDAAKQGSSLILTGAEAVNYLAGNTLRRGGAGDPVRFTYFASRGVVADGSEGDFVVRTWDRNRADLCVSIPDGGPACRSVQILLDGKQELQGGRLGTVTIGATTAELIKGNVMHVPPHIPFLDSAIDVDASPAPKETPDIGWAGLVDHTAAITTDTGAGRRFVYYAADNRRLDVQPIEAGPGGGRVVKVTAGHWRLSKATLCETGASPEKVQTCFKPQPLGGGAVRLVPVTKGGQALRAMPLPETRARAVAED